MSNRISKSKFVAGCQCLKRLYLQVHEPELAAEPDAAADAIIEQGREVGIIARQLFPGGVEIPSECRLDEAIRATCELVANPEVPAIFEGVFEQQNVLVKVDVLQRQLDWRWKLIEVKSTTEVKDHHLEDVAIQHWVGTRSGVDLAASCLAHVNRDYVYEGGPIDASRFFKIRNLTRQVESLQPELTVQLHSEFRILAMPEAPNISAGRQCSDPFTCEFFDHCNPPIPDDHILRLPRIHASTVAKLVALGVQSIHDIPEDYPLTGRLRRACTSVQTGEPWYSPEIREELRKLKYPLYFMDFETANGAIPGLRAVGVDADARKPGDRSVSGLKVHEVERIFQLAQLFSDFRAVPRLSRLHARTRTTEPSCERVVLGDVVNGLDAESDKLCDRAGMNSGKTQNVIFRNRGIAMIKKLASEWIATLPSSRNVGSLRHCEDSKF